MQGVHGGDIYRNRVDIDFSVNANPLGMPENVREALYAAIDSCGQYPDTEACELKSAISKMLSVPGDFIVFGNGASELFMGMLRAVKPRRTLIPIPSFYGYEYAAEAVESDIVYFPLKEEKDFLPGKDLWEALTEETDLLFLANPNNPTGKRMDKEYLETLLGICREKNILVALDECFIEFCKDGFSMLPKIGEYDNLLIIRAATKIFAIPGVRLGYMISSNRVLRERIGRNLPEWNLSVFAQAAGAACQEQSAYLAKTVELVRTERQFLEKGLTKLGIRVFPGEANFVLVYSEVPLYEKLLQRGILIRDCQNFRGLSKGYYRIAVRKRQDNTRLLEAVGECIERDRTAAAGRN
ncbi:MAG: aminotransferase class I/II-fold pyridoxal phosphate-dependent enzyme [Bacteroidales bacterium]|nr:aminotransferase class I/II-fold pyridoxal phosphate-dependent enzyme [Lachnoclostridium sp.]MCM1384247.1 aminotransferase class I/II-fold pyridoxal phosphate-dependent enzyme [Lachnoclostridium sp.]MCM1464746.1 aminotransferase class I/II-fold pyridoxal phosphate-dependent enzyme [Bacteroidales bacterium]